jgi:rhodanese-related sulfurtransferase
MPDHRREKEGVRMVATIRREELESKLDRGDDFLLVETLPEEQYRYTHLPGALNLPPDALRESAPELLPDKDADISRAVDQGQEPPVASWSASG